MFTGIDLRMEPTMQLLLVLLSAVFCRHALSDTVDSFLVRQSVEADPDLENYLREAIENFRDQMREGIDVIGMPVLDPLELQNLEVNVYENMATLDLKIHKITVVGLSDFDFRDIYPDLDNFYLEFNFSIPRIISYGKYHLNGKLAKIFPLKGRGDFQINVTHADISGLGKLDFVEDTLQMSQLKLDLNWREIAAFLENFLGGGKFSEVIQRIIPGLGKNVFENFKPQILDYMNNALLNEVNKQLLRPEVKKIIEGILPEKKEL